MKSVLILTACTLLTVFHMTGQSGLNINHGTGVSSGGYLTVGSEHASHIALAANDI